MNIDKVIKTVGPLVGLVGGTLAIVHWLQELSERRRKHRGEQDYGEFVGNVVKSLSNGKGNAVNIPPEQNGWAARAVAEKRVVWGPDGKTLMLPR